MTMARLASTSSLRREVFFFDATLSDLITLTSSLPANAEMHLIDPAHDGLEQIALTLDGRSGIDALHIYSHGSAGSLLFGSTTLSSSNINSYASTLSQIGTSLSEAGDILLYGCNVAAGAEGQAFVESVARLTQADVAASDDVTGRAALGADWLLEVQSGAIESVVQPLAGFDGVLGNTAPTFMVGDGKVTIAIGIGYDSGQSVAVQSDGRILVAGYSYNDNNYDVALVRYNSNGTLDTTFSGDGKLTTAIGIGDDYGRSVAVQSDGKIVVAGTTDGDFAIVRYNSNGTLDTTFDTDGKVITSFDSGDDSAQSIAVQSDGKIVVAGYSNDSTTGTNNFGVARYNSDGSLDTTFDTDGKLTTALGTGNDYGYSMALQSDGKIVVAGYSYYSSSYGYSFALVRYNSNGSLDTTFDTDGKVTTDLGSYYADDYGYSIAVQSDGKIVVAGTSNNGDFALMRYNSNGSLDTTFDTDGKVTTPIGAGYDSAQSVAVQSDGKILVAGRSYNGVISGFDIALVRYNSNGSLDTTFDGDGKVTTGIGNYDDYGWSVAVQSDGKILVTGESNSDVVLVRYNRDGSLDTRFDSTMQNILNGSPVYTEGSAAVALDSDVQIFDAELAALGNYSGATLALARHGGSSADDHFSGAGIVAGQATGTVTAASIGIGSYTWTSGSLQVTFNELATQRLVNQAMQSLAYQNASDALSSSSIQIDWTFNDGNSGSQGIGDTLSATGSTTVHIPDNTAPTFMVGDGKVTTAIGTGVDSGRSVVVQSDGKILVAGYSYNDNNYDVTLARYNSDGTLDTTFSGDGRLTTSISTGNDYGYSVALQSDGKIVVAGTTDGDFAIVRYNSNGTLDTTFDTDGKVITSFDSGDDSAQSIAVQSDGKIVVAGYSNDSTTGTNNFGVARYNSDGSLDTTFDTDGKLTTALGTGNDYGYSMALQSDGKIVVAGYSYYSSSYGYSFALVRYNSNGSLDTTFDTDGKVTTDLGSYYADDYGYSIAVQSDGKIVVAGTSNNGDFALMRYNSNGSLDTTFDTDGKVTTPIGAGYDSAQSVAVQSDGKILVAGRSYNGVISGFDIALVRYNSNGSLDTTFDGDGKVTTGIGNYDDYGWSVAVQSDGKILVTGESNSDVVLVRYNRDGSLDTRFDSTMQNILNGSPVYTEGSAAVALDSDVQIFDAELAALGNYSGATLALARHGGSSADDHFSGAGIVAGQATGTVTAASIGIGSYTWTSGSLQVTFNELATQRLVNQAMQSLAYQNASDALSSSSIQIDWTFNDGNNGSQGIGDTLSTTGSTTVNIIGLNNIPALTAFAVPVESTKENLQTEITFAELAAAGNEADTDGTMTAFVVASLSSGRLKIGTSAATATFWNPTTNNTIDTIHHAYWLPETNALGTVNAFTAVAQDNNGGLSATPVQATVTVQAINDAPLMLWHQTSVFAAKTTFGTGGQPIAITNGDFNGDGKPDLATANQTSSTVSVLLNNGNGTFANKIESATGASPTSLTSADFNGDGHADLAVAIPSGNIVSVLSGGIAAKVDYQTGAGSGPCAVTSTDFNNDGYADLATANKTNQTASVLLNNGNGTFAAKVDYTVGAWACALASADFNSDGKTDLAVANRDSDTISILLNNGNGTFAAKKDYSTGDSPVSVTAADFNGDGYTDLAIANSTTNTIILLHNLGNGSFVLANKYSTGNSPSAVTSADVNDDGYTDLVVANSASNSATILLNNGDGTFTTIGNDATGVAPSALTAADCDGDGNIDLAVALSGESNISLLKNNLQPPALSAFARKIAVPIAVNIVITDPDGNESWNGGSLRVEITANAEASDTLALPTTNPGNNGIWLDSATASRLMAGMVVIGTADAASVTDATAWTLNFNSNATNELVQSVARALTFTSSSTVTTPAVRDITLTATDNSGNSSYAVLHYTINADTSVEFGTNPSDTEAPTLASFPQSEALNGITADSNLAFIFNETIRSGSGFIELHSNSENGPLVEQYNATTSGNLTIAGETLTINPSADLQNGTHYFVTFDAGAIKDRAGNSYSGTDVCHVTTEGVGAEYHNLTGDITFWKTGAAITDVTTTLTSQPATQFVELRNMQIAADGSRTVELWATSPSTTVNSLQLEFVLPTGSKASWQTNTGLPAEWTVLANSELDGQFVLGGMSTTALASGPVKLGTLMLTATTTPQHAELLLSKGFVGHDTVPAFGIALESTAFGPDSHYQHLDTLAGTYTLAGNKIAGQAESHAINANDALAALKMSVALNPNGDGSAVLPYQFLAADVNKDGIIRSTDALNILKMAIKLSSAPEGEWLFVSENGTSAIMDRDTVDWSHVIPAVTLDHDVALDLIGIVKGDVDGSWAA